MPRRKLISSFQKVQNAQDVSDVVGKWKVRNEKNLRTELIKKHTGDDGYVPRCRLKQRSSLEARWVSYLLFVPCFKFSLSFHKVWR